MENRFGMQKLAHNKDLEKEIVIANDDMQLQAILAVPNNAKAIIVFAHGSGSGRLSPRNNFVAEVLQKSGLATLLIDLLSKEEEQDRSNVFDIELLAQRLHLAKAWISKQADLKSLKIGYFGASTGAGAALMAGAQDPENIFAIVSRGGRPDLAGKFLSNVLSPTLLLVGGNDGIVITLNKNALNELHCIKALKIIPGATHLFEELGTLEQVASLASDWFSRYL